MAMADRSRSKAVLELLRRQIEQEIKKDIVSTLLDKYMSQAEKEIRETLEERTKDIVVDRLETYRDALDFDEMLGVSIFVDKEKI